MNRIRTYLKDFSLLKPAARWTITGILFLLFIAGFVTMSTLRGTGQDISSPDGSDTTEPQTPYTAAMTPIDQPTPLTLRADTSQVQADQTFRITVMLDTSEVSVDGVNVVVRFHPGRVRPVAIEPGDSFALYPNQEFTENEILISARNYIRDSTRASGGKQIVATVTMQALDKPDTVFFAFDPQRTTVLGVVNPTPVEVKDTDVAVQINI